MKSRLAASVAVVPGSETCQLNISDTSESAAFASTMP